MKEETTIPEKLLSPKGTIDFSHALENTTAATNNANLLRYVFYRKPPMLLVEDASW
jgi:hypothetical protein